MKLKGITFKDALVYLGMKSGRPIKADPAIQREKQIQKNYEAAVNNLYENLCQQSRKLHNVRVSVKRNPGALNRTGGSVFR